MKNKILVLALVVILCGIAYAALLTQSGKKITGDEALTEPKTQNESMSESVSDTQNGQDSKDPAQNADGSDGVDGVAAMTSTEEPKVVADPNARATTLVAGGCFWCV
jgi:hypothetical protein